MRTDFSCSNFLLTVFAVAPALLSPILADDAVVDDPLLSQNVNLERKHDVTISQRGPWGTLKYYDFYLEAPDSLAARFNLPSPITRWAFDQSVKDSLPKILADAGLDAVAVQRLLSPRRMTSDGPNVFIFPTRQDVESLSSQTRSQFYRVLASNKANEFQASPILFLTDTVAEWAEDSGLPDRIVNVMKSLSYLRGKALAFSDVPLLISLAKSDSEAHLIFRKLTRVKTLLARIEISDDEDLPKLIDYWTVGTGLRRKGIEPMLLATRQTKSVSHLDLLHLLPPLARKLLYTYADPTQAALGRFPDCHWTSLNFFNFQPQNYYLDTRLAASAVLENHAPVRESFRYGDILMFLDKNQNAVHSCIYLADDLVFTKNGANIMTPWVLMHLDDLKKLYDVDEGVTRIEGFRRKAPPTD